MWIVRDNKCDCGFQKMIVAIVQRRRCLHSKPVRIYEHEQFLPCSVRTINLQNKNYTKVSNIKPN